MIDRIRRLFGRDRCDLKPFPRRYVAPHLDPPNELARELDREEALVRERQRRLALITADLESQRRKKPT